MKTVSRLFAVASLCLAGFASFAGCAVESAPPTEATGTATAPEKTVIRLGAEDFAALKPGELLTVDLNLPNTVYAVTYSSPADLDRVLALQGDTQYIVGNRAPAHATEQMIGSRQIILSGEPMIEGGTEAVAPPAGGEHIGTAQQADIVVSCDCPCTITITFSDGSRLRVSC
jgi:hypothetical protein